ncbi:MAG: murein biosynthesis integral membrane protein MurJ [Actinomycetes bacterium]
MSDAPLMRSSSVMAAGTLASRFTGVFKNIALVAAVGTGVFADTYSVANMLPTVVYTLFIGGAINAVFVPQLVRRMKDDEDGGTAYAHRLVTAVGLVLLLLSVLAVLFAPLIVRLYSSGWNEQQIQVSTAFARLMLPQIFFYGAFTVLAQVLNARGRFGVPMFAPIVNNVVVILSALAFLWVAGIGVTTRTVTEGEILLLGIGTTLGTVFQALVLVPVLRRTGFSFRPRFDLRGHGLGKAWSLARWTITLVLINQVGTLLIVRLATKANVQDATVNAGAAVYTNAYTVFILPQSVITVSIVTALLPQLSRLAHEGQWDVVRERMSWALRTTTSLLVPCAAVLVAFGEPIGILLFGYGSAGVEGAQQLGLTVAAYAVGLPAFSAYYTLLRGYYALEDTRTPTINALLLNGVNVAIAYLTFPYISAAWRIPALGLAYALSYWVALVPLWMRLARRLDGLQTALVVRTFVRVCIATTISVLVAVACYRLVTSTLDRPDQAWSIAVALTAGLVPGGAVYLGLSRVFRIGELSRVLDLVARRG